MVYYYYFYVHYERAKFYHVLRFPPWYITGGSVPDAGCVLVTGLLLMVMCMALLLKMARRQPHVIAMPPGEAHDQQVSS